jgi:hypothetical protein
MSELLEALKQKVKKKGASFQEVVDSLPCLSKDSLTEAEANEACEVLTPHVGEGSFVLQLIRAKVRKTVVAKTKKTLKSILKPKPKKKPSKKKED